VVPTFVDGRSLVPFLQGETPPSWRQALLLEHKAGRPAGLRDAESPLEPSDAFDWNRGNASIVTGFAGLRTADGISYVEYATGEHELYDNGSDPGQLLNAYDGTPDWQRVRLSSWLNALKGASGDALREAELDAP
jgi:hypothetical protein